MNGLKSRERYSSLRIVFIASDRRLVHSPLHFIQRTRLACSSFICLQWVNPRATVIAVRRRLLTNETVISSRNTPASTENRADVASVD